MKQLLQLTLTLTIVAALSGLAVSSVNRKTAEPIKKEKEKKEAEALAAVLPAADSVLRDSISYNEEMVTYWLSFDESAQVNGYAIKCKSAKGYSSKIEYIVALSADGRIQGLSILSQAETPGLGARMEETISKGTFWTALFGKKEESALASPWFPEQFKELNVNMPIAVKKSLSEWHLLDDATKTGLAEENGVTAITGATISTVALSNSVQKDGKHLLGQIIAKHAGEEQ